MTRQPATAFGALLRHYRLRASLSQLALAERAGLSLRAVSDLERGVRRAPYPFTVQQLADALGLAPADRARLVAASRPDAAPPPSSPATPPVLPLPLTRLIGREEELAEARRLLAQTRLLTLTGVGGVGKTRLALAVAEAAWNAYADGVWFITLAALADPTLVLNTIARALGLQDQSGQPLRDQLSAWLADKHLLLVLDNCEHLLDACAPLVEDLLQGSRRLQVLVTSREPVRIVGETIWRVPSLSLPPIQPTPTLADLRQSEAVALFVERAQAARPDAVLTNQTAPLIARLCQCLDGIPLAIELAAARARVLTVAEIDARLDDRFRLLTGGSRTALPRHQTVRATLDWSYGLLTEPEQAVFRRLAVFAGGWTLPAAEQVCSGDGIAAREVLDLLTALVDKSLVQLEDQGRQTRYRLLETVRRYASDQLQGEERQACQRQHLAWCLALAEEAEPWLRTREQRPWMDRLATEEANLRAALAWSLEDDPQAGLRLVALLSAYWDVRDIPEARHWLEALLLRAPKPTRWRARALRTAGILALNQATDLMTARARCAESVALSRTLGDPQLLASALDGLGSCLVTLGEQAAARTAYEEALALARATGDRLLVGNVLSHLTHVAHFEGQHEQARAFGDESLALLRVVADGATLGWSLNKIGALALTRRDAVRARALLEEALAVSETAGDVTLAAGTMLELARLALWQGDLGHARVLFERSLTAMQATGGNRWSIARALLGLGRLALLDGDVPRARAVLEESLTLWRQLPGERRGTAETLEVLGQVACIQGDYAIAHAWLTECLMLLCTVSDTATILDVLEDLAGVAACAGAAGRAVRLAGAAEAQREVRKVAAQPWQQERQRCLLIMTKRGSGALQAIAWSAGRTMAVEQAIDYALAEGGAGGRREHPPG